MDEPLMVADVETFLMADTRIAIDSGKTSELIPAYLLDDSSACGDNDLREMVVQGKACVVNVK